MQNNYTTHGDKDIHDTVFLQEMGLIPPPQFPKLGQSVQDSHKLGERHMG